ncbi:AREL1 ligase, partial [Polypterus senegalus]
MYRTLSPEFYVTEKPTHAKRRKQVCPPTTSLYVLPGSAPITPFASRRALRLFRLCTVLWILFWEVKWNKTKENQIEEWINGNGFSDYRHLFKDVLSLEELSFIVISKLEEAVVKSVPVQKLQESQNHLLREFALQEWLWSQGLEHYYHTLKALGCTSLDDLAQFDQQVQLSLASWGYYYEDYVRLSTGIKFLQTNRGHCSKAYDIQLVESLLQRQLNEKWSLVGAVIFGCTVALCVLIRDLMFYVIGGITVSIIAFVFTIKFLCELAARVVSFLQNEERGRRGDRTIYDYVRGNYLDPRSCKVSWDWKEPQEVGHAMTFRVHLFYKNGQPFPAARPVGLRVHISHIELAQDIPISQEVLQEPNTNVVKVAFTVRKAGRYEITVKLGGLNVAYSPYYKVFQPGAVVPSKTKITCHFSTLVLTAGQQHTLQVEPRDEYGNPTNNSVALNDEHVYGVQVLPLDTQDEERSGDYFSKSVVSNKQLYQVLLKLTLLKKGCFRVCISYQYQTISNGEFDIIVLSENEKNTVEKNVSTPGMNIYFEAYLYNTGNYSNFFWQLPSSALLVPQRRLSTANEEDEEDRDSPSEGQVEKVKKPKKVYCYISPKFSYHGPDPIHKHLTLVVDDGMQPPVELSCKERNIMAATFIRFLHKNIGGSETFQDKVNFFQRELRQLHSKRPRTKICLKISRNFLLDTVHPNSERPVHFRLKVYEFAGKVVGKCLYESALGGAYKQLVRARFTRSFLAQIIGLRMSYKYFETDDPEFYKTKVCFVINNDVNEMDLVFAEEKYNSAGQLEKVIELVAGGAQVKVTNENKILYLNLLAQYRLASQVREEVEHFLKGLNELVPENLLAIFDENELEVMKWFWAVVSSFTQEELARLLQFTTGSSQLPPGGFAALCPSFQIIAAPTHSTLPTAHTCFNQLCLPTYDSCEELHKMLKLAISEGCEGFGML